ncbi:hypothetical protein [Dactylosporangium salmoneum]|uniref:DUF4350 domain-containing protein n=1 Tax=Dactylosporangium salmoneum TaxID=53361 RepID=A0ABP5U8I9_9ACTN
MTDRSPQARDAADPLRRVAADPLRRVAADPLRRVAADPLRRVAAGPARWVALAIAAASIITFIAAQRQSADVTYGHSPSTATVSGGSAGENSDALLPSVDDMKAMVAERPVVRLPGAVAEWDQAAVAVAVAGTDVRIIVAPPGLTDAQQDKLRDVDNATVRVIGTEVSGGMYRASSTTPAEWRNQLARNDVTELLVTLVHGLRKDGDKSSGDADRPGLWRDPTAAELATVADGLRGTGMYAAPGATLTGVPATAAAQAFGDTPPLVAALPPQPRDKPAPDYGAPLSALFPDRPLIVMYGAWIEYHGPHAADFAEITTASFYARFEERLSSYAYPQDNVLGAYLALVTDVRFAGLFDRPLPFRPFDPVRVALPVLPWLFAACVIVFLLLSAAALPGRRPPAALVPPGRGGSPARLAGLAALAVEVSGLTAAAEDPALARAIESLGAARDAIAGGLPDRHVAGLLDDAEHELDAVGRAVGVRGYRPGDYLRGRLA